MQRVLLAEYRKEYRQDNADDDACREGEVEAELLSLDIDVPGQAADIRDLVGKHETKPYNHEHHTKDDQYLAQGRHHVQLHILLPSSNTSCYSPAPLVLAVRMV